MGFSSTRRWARYSLWPLSVGLAMVGAGCAAVARSNGPALNVAEPSRTEPVTAGMWADPQTVRPGESFNLLVRVRIAGGHHIYSTNSPAGPFQPATLTLILPQELETSGDWIAPTPGITRAGESVYRDSVLFRRALRVRPKALDTPLSIKGELLCQACTEELCWPPGKIFLSASIVVVSKTKK